MTRRSPARLLLGSAQFGLAYGVSNAAGKVDPAVVAEIVAAAAAAGVHGIDTAPAYGDAETTLGTVLGAYPALRIVTKTPQADFVPGAFARALDGSLRRLGRDGVEALLVHRSGDLLGATADAIWAELEAIKRDGRARRIGVSVYDSAHARMIADRYPIDAVQLPWNALDQRAAADGFLDRLRARGVEIHARSVFLQGLLLMDPRDLPEALVRARPALERFRAAARDAGRSPLQAAMDFAIRGERVERIVVGVTSRRELDEILGACALPPSAIDFTALASDDAALVDPRTWATA